MKDIFINAINQKRKLRVTFYSFDDGRNITRVCAPMDFGPSRRAKEKNDRYHFWDFESDKANHTLSLNPEQVKTIEIMDEEFSPESFITWDTNKSKWFIPRDWGKFS